MVNYEAQIQALIFSPSVENQELGWLLDESQNEGQLKLKLQQEYSAVLKAASLSIEELLQTKKLYCWSGDLHTLKLANLPWLEKVHCGNESLEKVEVVNCSRLEEIALRSSGIRELILSDCERLQFIYCCQEILKKKIINGCPNVEEAYCKICMERSMDMRYCEENMYNDLPDLPFSISVETTSKVSWWARLKQWLGFVK